MNQNKAQNVLTAIPGLLLSLAAYLLTFAAIMGLLVWGVFQGFRYAGYANPMGIIAYSFASLFVALAIVAGFGAAWFAYKLYGLVESNRQR